MSDVEDIIEAFARECSRFLRIEQEDLWRREIYNRFCAGQDVIGSRIMDGEFREERLRMNHVLDHDVEISAGGHTASVLGIRKPDIGEYFLVIDEYGRYDNWWVAGKDISTIWRGNFERITPDSAIVTTCPRVIDD